MQKLIECVPNFSEGRDENIITQISDAIKSTDGVSLLDVDPGATTNRTVVTFVGNPDFGLAKLNEKAGATAIGAREFLVAYNVNLNTKSVRRANSVAFDVREQGRFKTEDGTPSGKKVLDAKGEPVRIPGMLKHVKAIGWFVKEYGVAQVSMNLTNIEETPLHAAFDACFEAASNRGLRVTGSEIVGMVPKKCLIDAGRYFLRKQKWSEGASEEELIEIAVRSMGLSELKHFDPKEKVIELKIESDSKSLVKMNLLEFCNETLSDSPAPGGGSVAALMGALGASLGGMVANLSAGKHGWDDKLEYFSKWAVKAQNLKDELLALVDEDTAAFNKVMDAFGLPKQSAEEKAARTTAIQSATKYAAEIPLKVMEISSKSYELLAEMAEKGNPASASDVGVGALATRACIEGAALNVKINLAQLKDEKFKGALAQRMRNISADSDAQFENIYQVVGSKLR